MEQYFKHSIRCGKQHKISEISFYGYRADAGVVEDSCKQSPFGMRICLENFGQYDNIKVYPLYAISNIIKNI